ncbi:MAG TPA: TetR/AcrR family transcriptional regulator [Trebonia sp.]
MPRTAAETRSHLLQVAGDLFYWKGIRATGVDQVAASAGVAPTTLYRLFGSKDDLVAAYVEHTDQGFREMTEAAVATAGPGPRDQILAIFDAVYQQIGSGQFRGCAMMMTLAEFPDPALPAHRNAVAGKAWIRNRIGELAGQLGAGDPAELADHLTLILEGLLATGQALGPDGPAKQARRLAEVILACAAEQPPRPADQEL